MAFILGIDTGGTYTDGVLIDVETKQVYRKAKALTTKDDLVRGISNCIEKLNVENYADIDMVCLSTTLATNAIVEGKGCDAGLLLIGKAPHGELPVKRKELIKGLFTIAGKPVEDLDEEAVLRAVRKMKDDVDALAISGYASIRNPEHELKAKALVQSVTDLPVVCAHELTGKLGYYERTVTAVLNVQLIPIIRELVKDTKIALTQRNIHAPVMIVKGDGNFMTSGYAEERAIETILSGPAASIIGAMHLVDVSDATIIDMGGTTSDIALVENGHVEVVPEGAKVGKWKTHVRAADIVTFGIGGDSKLRMDSNGQITFGPDKTIPISYFTDHMKKDQIAEAIQSGLVSPEATEAYGFTPTDLAHIQGLYRQWNTDGAQALLDIVCVEYGCSIEDLVQDITDALFSMLQDALHKSGKTKENAPLIAIGAPAGTWMRMFAEKYGADVCVPEHSEVANAIGAAVGRIEEKTEVLIRYDTLSSKYVGYLHCAREEFDTLEDAKQVCAEKAEQYAKEKAYRSGCMECEILKECNDIFCDSYDGKQKNYIETKMNFIAVGIPECIRKGEE